VLDFAWPDRLVYAEYNGLAFHSGASAVAHDDARTSALSELGWRGLFFDETTPERRIIEQLTNTLSLPTPFDGAGEHRLGA
jgi:hypothetical protein